MRQTPLMRRNAALFDGFCRDVKALRGTVTVGLSGTGVADPNEPAHDLVVYASVGDTLLSARVDRTLAHALGLLRERLGIA